MADEEENQKYEHLEKHKKRIQKVNKLIETTDLHHRQAYNKAVEDILKDESGLIDYELLEKDENQNKFADTMADFYISKAKQALKSDIPEEDELGNEMLMRAYTGFTKAQLKRFVAKDGKRFTYERFNKVKDKLSEGMKESLTAVASDHIKEEHIEDIIKYTKLEDKIDATRIDLDKAKGLLGIYQQLGEVPKQYFDEIGVPDYAKKEHKKYKKAA